MGMYVDIAQKYHSAQQRPGRVRYSGRVTAIAVAAMCCLMVLPCFVATAAAQEPSEAEFEGVADRYWQVLTRRPRKSTAFDYWYRHHAEAGRLDELYEQVDQSVAADPDAPQTHLLRGLLLERDRRLPEALEAYAAAERLAADDYYPPFCRGMLLFAQQRYRDAAAALERSLALQPPRADLVEIVQASVRCQLRLGNRDAARRIWTEFSAAIAGDPYTLRRLAEVVTAEGDALGAIELWQQLADRPAAEPLARVTARIEIAQLHADQGHAEEAIRQFRAVLAQLKPDGWLARDVCRRIERTFLQDENMAGLVEFWQEQRARLPQDLQTFAQLARAMRMAGQTDEAMEVYREALQLAPSHGALRRAFIDVLVNLRELDEAIRQCETLLTHSPADVEVLRMLGQLYLKVAPEEEQEAAQERAIAAWRRIAELRPNDPAAALTAAEACRHASRVPSALRAQDDRLRASLSNTKLLDAAEVLYREAAERASAEGHHLAVPYLEHLGEFFHALQEPQEAIAVWQSICAPPHDSRELVLEAAETFFKYGYLSEAEDAARQATAAGPPDYRAEKLLLQVLLEQESYDAAFARLAALDAAADTPVRREEARQLRVQVCTAGGFTEREIARLEGVAGVDAPDVAELWLLGLLKSSAGQLDESIAVMERAVELSGDAPRLINDYAVALQRARKLAEAASQYERLIVLEPHRRITHYRSLVQLQMQQGKYDEARAVADRLVELVPDDAATYQIRIQVARWTGNREEQIELLREAAQSMPMDVAVRRQLAHALADGGHLDEALAEFWRCWELSPSLADRVSLVAAMSDMLQTTNSRQPLIDRLRAAERAQPRAVGICLAEAYRRMGDFAQARRALTSLLAADDRDIDVLRQLAALAAEEMDWQAALVYQEQVAALDNAWTNVVDWARYYSESKRDEWLSGSLARQRQLLRGWSASYRAYREMMQAEEPSEAALEALRQELVNLNWAQNKYHEKVQLLDPESTQQRRYGDVWQRLRLEFEILELASRGPVTAAQIEWRLADSLRRVGTSAEYTLGVLCDKELLRRESLNGEDQYVAALSPDELLDAAVRDFGERMLGAEIELSDVELIKLEQLVEEVESVERGGN